MVATPGGLLEAALAADPGRPLITAYDHATGERTELSVATFANWVAKTANLLRDELDVQPGGTVAVRLPLHWQAAVLLQATWAVGAVTDLDTGSPADVAAVEHSAVRPPCPAGEVVSLGLGPMGLARPGVLPACPGALDYDRSVHAHGDRFAAVHPPDPGADALQCLAGRADARALVDAARAVTTLAPGDRVLVTQALDTLSAVLGAVLVPLATGATAVLVRHLDPTRLADLVAQENLVATLPGGPDALSRMALPLPDLH